MSRILPTVMFMLVSMTACSGLFDLPSDTGGAADISSPADVDLPDAFMDIPFTDIEDDSQTLDVGCKPLCYYRVCGSDGCGGVCGACAEGTSCSSEQTMCIPNSVQAGLGGTCDRTEWCAPVLTNLSGYTYTNSDWPNCLNDQCLEGACMFGVCSRPCEVRQDVMVNGTNLQLDDGIEDVDVEGSDCAGGELSEFTDGYACVATVSYDGIAPETGVCVPRSSFTPCTAGGECPDGETCGYLAVRGTLEARCLATVPDGGELGESCGYDSWIGATVRCNSWNCSADGCTAPCSGDLDCLSDGAECDPATSTCREGGQACETDADCSAWMCRSALVIDELDTYVPACGPRKCVSDAECLDSGFYCHHDGYFGQEAGNWVFNGWCRSLTKGGAAVGEACRVDPDDGLPDIVCSHGDYCFDGACSGMCASDEDCPLTDRCGMRLLPAILDTYGFYQTDVMVPMCIHLGEDVRSCEAGEDCGQRTCTPWIEYDPDRENPATKLSCAEPPEGSSEAFSLCGVGASGATCANRSCLLEDSDNLVPGLCSIPCRDIDDCPEQAALGADVFAWVCSATVFSDVGTGTMLDDRYVSWCVPVPGGSSLEFCGDSLVCSNQTEVCRAFVRSGLPGGGDAIDYRCVAFEDGLPGFGQPCDPAGDGLQCATGICSPTKEGGLGLCSGLCLDDQDCALLGDGFSCRDKVEIPQDDSDGGIRVPQCAMSGECVVCGDDRDCSQGYACINASALYFYTDRRCARTCEVDSDCLEEGEGVTCIEATGIPVTTPSTTVNVCGLPICG